ncbi:MAG: hypothetical protein ACK5NF_05280 [Bacilli bacterium]
MKSRFNVIVAIFTFSLVIVCSGIYGFLRYEDNILINKEIKQLDEEVKSIDETYKKYKEMGYIEENTRIELKNLKLDIELDLKGKDSKQAKEKIKDYRVKINDNLQLEVNKTFEEAKKLYESEISKSTDKYNKQEELDIMELKNRGSELISKESVSLDDIDDLENVNIELAKKHGEAKSRIDKKITADLEIKKETARLNNQSSLYKYETSKNYICPR